MAESGQSISDALNGLKLRGKTVVGQFPGMRFTGLGRPEIQWFTADVEISQQISNSGASKSRPGTTSE
jgi:hypothetical protein